MSEHQRPQAPRGRGAAVNPDQRFSQLHVAYDEGEEPGSIRTKFFIDHSSTIISRHDSPDLGFQTSLNPYRGCEHGCAYCYARPTHEYLGFSAGFDFESRIMVKQDAAKLLRAELSRPSYRPGTMALSGVTDPYQPVERRLRITRSCLEVLAECRHPVAIVTKNHLITRDIDLLTDLASYQAAAVFLSINTLDADLARRLEPRASSPRQRLDAVQQLAAAGVPVGVLVAPIIPAINDSDIPGVLEAAAAAGARFAGYTVVRLPFAVKDVFKTWLEEHFPDRKDKVIGRIESCQGRTLSHPEFGRRMRGEGIWAEQIRQFFQVAKRRAGIGDHRLELSAADFRRPRDEQGQLELF